MPGESVDRVRTWLLHEVNMMTEESFGSWNKLYIFDWKVRSYQPGVDAEKISDQPKWDAGPLLETYRRLLERLEATSFEDKEVEVGPSCQKCASSHPDTDPNLTTAESTTHSRWHDPA